VSVVVFQLMSLRLTFDRMSLVCLFSGAAASDKSSSSNIVNVRHVVNSFLGYLLVIFGVKCCPMLCFEHVWPCCPLLTYFTMSMMHESRACFFLLFCIVIECVYNLTVFCSMF